MEITIYGKKRQGINKFIFVAPHGAGDDLKTGIIASRLARKLKSGLVINNKFIKPKNKRAKENSDYVEDFNRLRWNYSKKRYLWKKKLPNARVFFKDINNFCEKIREKNERPVVVYVHGMKHDKIGIDLGAGLKPKGKKLFGKLYHDFVGRNSGEITLKIGLVKKIKKELEKELKNEFGLEVSIGEKHTGWSKQSAIQYHKHEGRNDYALQLEISHLLRENNEKINYLVDLLTKVLQKNF